jgi:broad specificity phosphatase PhoE
LPNLDNQLIVCFFTDMKIIRIIRHSEWDTATGELTARGIHLCREGGANFQGLQVVYSSPAARCIQTARYLTGLEPKVDQRANVPDLTKDEFDYVMGQRHLYALGIIGALQDTPRVWPKWEEAGRRLLNLVADIAQVLPENGKALVVSHDGTMAAAQALQQGIKLGEITFGYEFLEGFEVVKGES